MQNFPNYVPSRAELTIPEFAGFLQTVEESNDLASQFNQQYRTSVQGRQAAFRLEASSIRKLLPQIGAAVQCEFGKDSIQYKTAREIISKIQNVRQPAAAVSQAPASVAGDSTSPSPRTVSTSASSPTSASSGNSHSKQSYGSLLGYFRDLIQALEQMPAYQPSNPAIQVATLAGLADSLATLSADVAKKAQILKGQRMDRVQIYEDLGSRVQNIKAYVKAQYGTQSKEFAVVKGVAV